MKVLDYRGLTKLWDRAKSYFARLNLTYGTRGYITGAGSNPDILLEKIKLGLIQLYQGSGVGITLYEYDAGDEENATLVWDSSTLTGDALTKFINGENLGTIYTSPAGKCVKAIYNGHTGGSYYYIRAFGIFMTPKQADNSHTASAVCTINGVDYKTYTVDTYGGLVTAVCPDGNYTTCIVRFTPSAETTRMRFYGFRCLNTYDGVDAVLIGRSSTTSKLYTARKLAVNLANSSTDSTFDGSADQTGIKVSGTLPVGNGGTGKTDAASACNMFINALSTATATPFDNDYYVSQHANGGTTTTTFYRRPVSALWNYIKGKLTSVSGVNISGNASTATEIKKSNISYHRPTDSTGPTADGKQWCRLGTLTDTAVAAGAQWFGIGVLFNVYSNPYGPQRTHFGCYEFSFRIGIAARPQGGADYSLKTSGDMAIQKLYGPDAPAAANGRSGIDFRIVRSDTKVELFIKNSVWDSSIYVERFQQIDGSGSYGTWEWAIANGLYTEEEFTEYCSDKTVKYLTKKYEFKANVADSTLWSNFYNGYKEVAFASSDTYETFCADRMTVNSFAYKVFGDTLDTTEKTINAIGRLNLSSASAIKTGIGIANDYPMFHVVATRQVGYVDIAEGSNIVRFSFGRYGTLSNKVTISTGDTKVTQTADNSSTGTGFEVLFSATGDNTTRTEASRKSSNLTFQPSTGTLKATKFSGPLTGNVTGNVTGNCSGSSASCTGNAATASAAQSGSALETAINNKADKSSTVSNVAWDSTNKKLTKTINGTTSDVVTAATLKSAMSLTNVTNDAQVKRTEMGTANGVATLDANGVINTSQLPSYVDDVLEYSTKSQFPATGETGKIYVDTSTNLTWRWSGTTYVEISPSLALGETSSTAYRGDRGKTAYDHSQLTSGNPHHVTAEDVKAVRYDTNAQGLTDTQKSNARTNIGAGTSNLTIGTTSTTAAAGNHAHGNITNGGALQTTDIIIANGDKLVVTDASDSNKIARTSVAFDGTTTSKALTQKGTFESVMTPSEAMSLSGGDGVDVTVANNAATLSANISSIPTSVIEALS